MPNNQTNNIIQILGKMKDLKRTGWLMKNVSLPESDADHSFGVAMLVLLLAPTSLNKLKCLEMALIHDLAEIYAGDHTPFDTITKEEKYTKELKAITQIADELNYPQLIELFKEYEEKTTPEAIFVKLADKLETVLTSQYYDQNNRSEQKLGNEFKEYAKKHINVFSEDYLSKIREIINNLPD